jgi:excisionase family DNA binding protein
VPLPRRGDQQLIAVVFAFLVFGALVLFRQRYQLFGKQPITGNDARLIGILFMVPFMAYLISNFVIDPAAALGVAIVMYGTSIVCIGLIAYTAFLAPEAMYTNKSVSTEKTVDTELAAVYLRITEPEVIALIESGKLQARKVGARYRIHKEILTEFAQAQQVKPQP